MVYPFHLSVHERIFWTLEDAKPDSYIEITNRLITLFL